MQLRYSAAFNLATTYKNRGDFDQARVWRSRLDQYGEPVGPAAVTAAVASIALYWSGTRRLEIARQPKKPSPSCELRQRSS